MRDNSAAVVTGLIVAVFLWGGNNVATKYLVDTWPPIWTSCTRFLISGALLLFLAHKTRWFGSPKPLNPSLKKALWFKGSLSFTVYILSFIWALKFSTAANMGLLFASSPMWALLWEIRLVERAELIKRFIAAALTLSGGLTDAANDSAAASAGVAVNQLYRNGSVVMIRVS